MKKNLFYYLLSFILTLSVSCSDKAYKATIKGHYSVTESTNVNEKNDSTTIFGSVMDKRTQLPISFATIQVESFEIGTMTDSMGNYSLVVPIGRYRISAKGAGNTDLITKYINVKQDKKIRLDFYLGTRILY